MNHPVVYSLKATGRKAQRNLLPIQGTRSVLRTFACGTTFLEPNSESSIVAVLPDIRHRPPTTAVQFTSVFHDLRRTVSERTLMSKRDLEGYQ